MFPNEADLIELMEHAEHFKTPKNKADKGNQPEIKNFRKTLI
jgi:hypothetical protein